MRHTLDAEIKAELRGYIEDRVRGYVSGAVKVSEADAMLLAKAHFGDAAVVKGMFQGVHAKVHGVSLARRLVAVFIVLAGMWGVRLVTRFLEEGAMYLFATKGSNGILYAVSYLPGLIFEGVSIVGLGLLFWAILAMWRKRERKGMRRMWFEKWNVITLALVVMASLLCVAAAEDRSLTESMSVFHVSYRFVHTDQFWLVVHGWVYPCVIFAVEGMLWIWWCDRGMRTKRTLVMSAAAYLMAHQTLLTVTVCSSEIMMLIVMPRRSFLNIFQSLSTAMEPWFLWNFVFTVPLLMGMLGLYVLMMRSRDRVRVA